MCNGSHIHNSRPQPYYTSRYCDCDEDFDVTQATNYLEISSDFMQIVDGDREDQKLMGDFGKHDKLLSTGLINS